jgi:L-cystine uptake protein TcyP (sodium:dicarboxylate symporter family)
MLKSIVAVNGLGFQTYSSAAALPLQNKRQKEKNTVSAAEA